MSPLLLSLLFLLLCTSIISGQYKSAGEDGVGGVDCQWYGTAPFCAGVCPKDKHQPETYVMSANIMANYGKICFTGSKVMCCKKRV